MPTSRLLLPAVRAVSRGCGVAPFRGGRWSFLSGTAVLSGRRPSKAPCFNALLCVASAVVGKFKKMMLFFTAASV